MMKALGRHMIVELYDCDREILNSVEQVQDILKNAAEISGATIIRPFFHKFSPHGVSGVVVVAESHFAIHTWPEYGYCAIDIFTCGDVIDNPKAFNYMKKEFGCKSSNVLELKRGMLDVPGLKHKVVCVES